MNKKISLIKNIFLAKVRKTPFKLNFAVTYTCNSECKTCNIWKLYKKNSKEKNNELTISEIKKISYALPKTITWISLTGGEPFLREDIVEIIRLLSKNCPSLRLISIPSNGLATQRIVSSVKKIIKIKIPNIFITFSLDGPPEINNKIKGIENAFERTLETYKKVKKITKNKKNFYIGLETNISKFNINFLESFLQDLTHKNNNLIITLAHNSFLYQNENDPKLLPEGSNDKIKKIIKIITKDLNWFYPHQFIQKRYLYKLPLYLKNQKHQVIPCSALGSSIALSATGEITPCFSWKYNLGNIRDYEYDIMRAWKSKKAELARKIIKNNKCPSCWTPCEAYQSIINHMFK